MVVNGSGYLVDPTDPQGAQRLGLWPIVDVREAWDGLMLWSFDRLLAVSEVGVAWMSAKVCLDDLEVLEITDDAVRCRGVFVPGDASEFVLSADDGSLVAGSAYREPFRR